MDYQQAKDTRKKSFGDLMSEKLVGGEGIGASFKKTLSEKSKAKAKGIRESFDPMNIAKKLTGGSNLAAAVVGKMTGRSKEDMEYFTGKKPGKGASGGLDKETMSTAVEILGLIYREMQRANEDKLSQQKSKDNTKETKADKDKKENDLLIEALTGKKKTRNQKKADRRREKKAEKKAKSADFVGSKPSGTSGKAGLGNAPSVGGKASSTIGSVISNVTGGATAAGGAVGTGAAAVGGAAVLGGVVAAGGLMGYASKVIASHEGLPKGGKAYYDPHNQKQLVSVGFGHQIQPHEYKQGFIQAGSDQISIKGERGIDTVVSQSQAQKLLSDDLPKYEERAKKPLGDSWNKLNDNQKTALISYAYNTGSTKSLVDAGLKGAIDTGDTQAAAKIIREKGIRTAGGVESKALVKRRNEEANLFAEEEIKSTEGSTTPSGPVNVNITKGAEEQKSASDSASKVGSGTLMQNIKLKDSTVNVDGLNDQVKSNFAKMAHEYFMATGKRIQVNSAFRSMAEQEELYKTKPPGIAAKPGSSMHNYGFAIDISSGDANALVQMGLMQKWGFERPIMPKETWHIAPKGLSHELAKKGIFSADAPTDQGANKSTSVEPTTISSGSAIQKASTENKDLKEQAKQEEQKPNIVNTTNINTQKKNSNTTVAANGDDRPAYLKKVQG